MYESHEEMHEMSENFLDSYSIPVALVGYKVTSLSTGHIDECPADVVTIKLDNSPVRITLVLIDSHEGVTCIDQLVTTDIDRAADQHHWLCTKYQIWG